MRGNCGIRCLMARTPARLRRRRRRPRLSTTGDSPSLALPVHRPRGRCRTLSTIAAAVGPGGSARSPSFRLALRSTTPSTTVPRPARSRGSARSEHDAAARGAVPRLERADRAHRRATPHAAVHGRPSHRDSHRDSRPQTRPQTRPQPRQFERCPLRNRPRGRGRRRGAGRDEARARFARRYGPRRSCSS